MGVRLKRSGPCCIEPRASNDSSVGLREFVISCLKHRKVLYLDYSISREKTTSLPSKRRGPTGCYMLRKMRLNGRSRESGSRCIAVPIINNRRTPLRMIIPYQEYVLPSDSPCLCGFDWGMAKRRGKRGCDPTSALGLSARMRVRRLANLRRMANPVFYTVVKK